MEFLNIFDKGSDIRTFLLKITVKAIGEVKECCMTDVQEEIKASIQSIIVLEFSGIDSIDSIG